MLDTGIMCSLNSEMGFWLKQMDTTLSTDTLFMSRALELAQLAAEHSEVPVGAVIVHQGNIVGEGYNQPISACDPTAHAEIVAMRQACATLKNYRLTGCELYVTIEPCTMCVGAMVHARIKRVVFGALEPRAGALQSQLQLMDHGPYNHSIVWEGGLLEAQCSKMISTFFRQKRDLKSKQTAK